MSYWAVVLRTGDRPDDYYVYGPLGSKNNAERFAKYLTAEVDPAWALEVRSPMTELLNWYDRTAFQTGQSAEHWPPLPGDTWQDREGHRWTTTAGGHLLHLIGTKGSAPADEINRLFGPMALVYRPAPQEEEPPF